MKNSAAARVWSVGYDFLKETDASESAHFWRRTLSNFGHWQWADSRSAGIDLLQQQAADSELAETVPEETSAPPPVAVVACW